MCSLKRAKRVRIVYGFGYVSFSQTLYYNPVSDVQITGEKNLSC